MRAHDVLLTRRRIADHEPGWALSNRGLATLRGGFASNAALSRRVDQVPDGDAENDKQDFEYEDVAESRHSPRNSRRSTHCSRERPERRKRAGRPVSRDASGLVYDEDCDEEARLSQWLEALKENEDLPPLMSAALAFEA